MFQSVRLLITACSLVLAIFAPCCLPAQFNTVWQKSFGGNNLDDLNDIQALSDGGFVLCGQTRSSNLPDLDPEIAPLPQESRDAWVVKTDPQGVVLWQAFPGGTGKDALFSVRPTDDGGFICAGSSESGDLEFCPDSPHGKADFWVVKLDAWGRTAWQRLFGGTGDDRALAVLQTAEGSIVVSGEVISKTFGRSSLDMLALKINEFGTIEWQRYLGGRDTDLGGRGLCADAQGNIFVTGSTASGDEFTGAVNKGGADAYVARLTPKGKIAWQRSFGGYADEEFTGIKITPDGGLLLVGNTASMDGDVQKNRGENDVWVVKTTESGSLQWQKTLGGSRNDEATAALPLPSGGFVIAGGSRSGDGDVAALHGNLQNPDAWLAQLDENGQLAWQKTFGGSQNDHFTAITACADGGFAVLGFTESHDNDDVKNRGFRDAWALRFAEAMPLSDRRNMVNQISVQPSLATNELFFDLKCAGDCPVEAVWFTDASGKVVFYRDNPASPVFYGALPSGLYFVHFKVQGRYVPAQRLTVSRF